MEQDEDQYNEYNEDPLDDKPIRFIKKEQIQRVGIKDLKLQGSLKVKPARDEEEVVPAKIEEEEVEQDLEKLKIMENCSLCKSMGCCPEHCCDWDSCECGDCTNCQGFSHHKEIGIKAPKKLLRSDESHKENYYADPKKENVLRKHVRIDNDTFLITNFEVNDPKEVVEERNGVKIYGGGIRGIRALKQEKEDEEEMKEDEKLKKEFIESHGDMYKRFEHKISKKE